jgi:hypothetical protein
MLQQTTDWVFTKLTTQLLRWSFQALLPEQVQSAVHGWRVNLQQRLPGHARRKPAGSSTHDSNAIASESMSVGLMV